MNDRRTFCLLLAGLAFLPFRYPPTFGEPKDISDAKGEYVIVNGWVLTGDDMKNQRN